MSLNLRRLKYFVATAEELHFGKAAERLGVSQPPLSVQIVTLEKELGVRLLERDRRRVKLTAAGAVLLDEGRKVLTQAERARDLALRAARGEHGNLTIGFITPVGYNFLPDLIRRHRQQYPGIALQLREVMTDDQVEELKAEKLDLGLLNGPVREPGIAQRRILGEPVIAAIPAGHPLSRSRNPLPIAALAAEDAIMFPRRIAPVLYDEILAWCAAHGFNLRITQEAPQTQTIISLVSAGLGIAIVPASIRNLRRRGVIYRPFRSTTPQAQISMAWLEHRSSPALQNFMALTKAALPRNR